MQQGVEKQYYVVLMTCQVCSSDFSSTKKCIFAHKYSILNIPKFMQYSKLKIQNVEVPLTFLPLVLHIKSLSAKKSEKV